MNKSLILSLIGALNVLLKIMTGSNVFLLLFILIVSYGIITDKVENKIEYLLFFISWIYVIKFNFNQFSLFILLSFLYIISIIIYMKKNKVRFKISLLIIISVFFTYILFVNYISNIESITDILGFLIGYVVIVLAANVLKKNDKFTDYTVMYSFGMIFSAFIGILRNFIPSIDSFLNNMTRLNTVLVNSKVVNRLAGLDLDPNYFASNIIVALSLLIVCIYYDKGGKKVCYLFTILFICGFLSLSKMYLIMSSLLLILSALFFLQKKPGKVFKILITFTPVILFILVLFGDLIFGAYSSRLNNVSNISEMTTGRFDIWLEYIQYIFNDFKTFLIGNGIGVPLNGHVSHNMYLLALYYIGALGIIITVILIIAIYFNIRCKLNLNSKFRFFLINNISIFMILILNLSLDTFFMDFFCYQILLSMLAIDYGKNSKTYIKGGNTNGL